MLRAYVLDFLGSWVKCLPLIEFAYNNSYQANIGMASYEAVYGRKCCLPIHWFEKGEKQIINPKLVEKTTEAIRRFNKGWLQLRIEKKSYADKK